MLIHVYKITTFIFVVIIQNLLFKKTRISNCENNTFLHTQYNVYPCELNIESSPIIRYNMLYNLRAMKTIYFYGKYLCMLHIYMHT